jgi:glycosyltransferase involved in cell wall biosynthesis
MPRLKILVWHLHGSYLYYLSQVPHDIYVPFRPERSGDYIGRYGHIPWPDNVHDVPAEAVRRLDLDCVVFQHPSHYLREQYLILSPAQRRLPRVYIQHDPPYEHPTDARHLVDDPNVLLVHVTPFNALMWDSGKTPVRVIDHGVLLPPGVRYTGDLERGIVVINNLARRGRLLGADVYDRVRREIPLDLVGMEAERMEGGLKEVLHAGLPAFEARYRFFFNPIRYTSLGLAVCEAMAAGMPIVGLATTEMSAAVQNGVSGYVDTDVEKLIPRMRDLLKDPALARRLGEGALRYARERFHIGRFVRDWNEAFSFVTGLPRRTSLPRAPQAAAEAA